MNLSSFLPIAQTPDCRQFAFFGLAYELTHAEQIFVYGVPCYHDSELGLSIVIKQTEALNYLELCIHAMGYEPIPEAGRVRVVMFSTVAAKEAFKKEFSEFYEQTLKYLQLMNGMHPADFYRIACYPQLLHIDDVGSSHSLVLSIFLTHETGLFSADEEAQNEEEETEDDIEYDHPLKTKIVAKEPAQTLWFEEIKRISDFIWEDSKQFDDINNWKHIQISFRSKKNLDHYIEQLESLKASFKHVSEFYKIRFCESPLEFDDFDNPILNLAYDVLEYEAAARKYQFDMKKPCGPFGLTEKNPVMTRSIKDSNDYLSRLTTEDVKTIKWSRLGSTNAPEFSNDMIDMYQISVDELDIALIYICPYHQNNSDKAPDGFIFLVEN